MTNLNTNYLYFHLFQLNEDILVVNFSINDCYAFYLCLDLFLHRIVNFYHRNKDPH